MKNSISVVIPAYNRQHTLARSLDSVLSQTLPSDEIIVIDDGSTDETSDLIKKYYPMIKYIKQKNQGVSAARNSGIRIAKGPWIALLDSDDVWHPKKLTQQMEWLLQNPSYKICHSDEQWVRNNMYVNPMIKHQKKGGWLFQHCLPLCVISPSCVIIHQTLFDNVGLFDESLPVCEDYDLWLRITAKFPVLYIKKKLTIKYGGHEDQLSKKFWGMDRFRIKALENIIKTGDLSPDNLKTAIKMLEYKTKIYLVGAKKRNKVSEVEYYEKILTKVIH